MWWTKFILLIIITVVVTWLIVRVDSWLKRNAPPEKRGMFRGFVWLMLNLRDVFK